MDGGGDRSLEQYRDVYIEPRGLAIIKEIYDAPEYHELFVVQLEKALSACCTYIIIEPTDIGDETARWIAAGNVLHKMTVVSGLSSIVASFVWPKNMVVQLPLTILSVLLTGLYTVAWEFDHCVNYQIERDAKVISSIPVPRDVLTTSHPVVLVRKSHTRRKILHRTVSAVAAAICAYRFYVWVK
ncbi:transmembrane protein 11 homolog, mitochondrial [Euwallacea fornicatus]|uniref:transmembrane protein 11 homolog, mitochondrial n=1 Tax=Euwallacea fornicatus TaxID=995702 RepID=UPI00338DA5C5